MTIDIQRFCAMNSDPREWLRRPWIEDGTTVATNGHIVVRVDTVLQGEIADAPHGTMSGRIPKVIAAAAHLDAVVSARDIAITMVPCRHCAGEGTVTDRECNECEGEGEFGHGTHWYCCKECDGDGRIISPVKSDAEGATPCDSCHGSGHDFKSYTTVGNSMLANRYLALLQDLPNCRLALPELSDQPVRFDFDGGTGVLMPMLI
jgi:hypothetical protein